MSFLKRSQSLIQMYCKIFSRSHSNPAQTARAEEERNI